MMRCNRCGHENEPTARFCVACGQQLVVDAISVESSPAESPNSEGAADDADDAPANQYAAQDMPQRGTAPAPPTASADKPVQVPRPDAPPRVAPALPSGKLGNPQSTAMALGPAGSQWPGRSPSSAEYAKPGDHLSRPSAPGSPPPLIVPGSAGLSHDSGSYHEAQPAAAPEAASARGIELAETAPPLVDAPMDQPIRDRGPAQPTPEGESAPPAQRPTHSPPAPPAEPPPTIEPVGVDPLEVPPDAPRVLAGFLVSYEGNAVGQAWSIFQGSNVLGRLGAGAGADVELPHATVSSKHATIYGAAHPGRLVLKDLGSTNGSFVNDGALQPEEPRELRDGDRVRFGLFPVIVKII